MSEYFVAIKRGTAEEEPEYPYQPKTKVDVWHVSGPIEKGLALNLLQRVTQREGAPNVELLVKVPWASKVSVHSDCDVKFVWPEEEGEETNVQSS